jgi:hypothetical protein
MIMLNYRLFSGPLNRHPDAAASPPPTLGSNTSIALPPYTSILHGPQAMRLTVHAYFVAFKRCVEDFIALRPELSDFAIIQNVTDHIFERPDASPGVVMDEPILHWFPL